MHISQIEITGFPYGVLNFVVSFKTQKIQWPKSIYFILCKYHQSEKGERKFAKICKN